MSSPPWTIDAIHDALGNPGVARRFLDEIHAAPAHRLLAVFAKWERVAEETAAAARRGRDLAAYEDRGEEPPGEWVDATERVRPVPGAERRSGAA